MSESEFEAYLSLLGKLLHLSARQRQLIAAELQDHLEEHFQALIAQGVPRDQALRMAVEALGDAAVLAEQFTQSHHVRHRRQLMRYSLGSAVVIATTFMMAALYWPAHQPEPRRQLQAQVDQGTTISVETVAGGSGSSAPGASLRQELSRKLDRRDFELDINEQPLSEVLILFSELMEVDILVDHQCLADQGIDESQPMTLKSRTGALSVRTALELVLEQLASDDISYTLRDGIIQITNAEKTYENRIYDCRDLLEGVLSQSQAGMGVPTGSMGGGFGGGQGGMGGGGMFQIAPETVGLALQPALLMQMGGMGMAPMPVEVKSPSAQLITVIENGTEPANWMLTDGIGGTITVYDGMLIVRHETRVHERIAELLEQLRAARDQQQHMLVVPPDHRIVTLRSQDWVAPRELVKPGSHIDILAAVTDPAQPPMIILEDVTIYAAHADPTAAMTNAVKLESLSLMVTPEQAAQLLQAESSHSLQLVFHSEK